MVELTGKGWSFPVNLGERDQVSLTEHETKLQQSVFIILNTIPGERVMRPSFGCRIHELLFAPANEQTAATAERYVREAVEKWEPRIQLQQVKVTPYPGTVGTLYIELTYKTLRRHDVRSLVYPFYLKPK